jgi:hypothetical protein
MDPLAKANADEPAFPITYPPDRDGDVTVATGLTKRELMAALIMTGIYSTTDWMETPAALQAEDAVSAADHLLHELSISKPETQHGPA